MAATPAAAAAAACMHAVTLDGVEDGLQRAVHVLLPRQHREQRRDRVRLEAEPPLLEGPHQHAAGRGVGGGHPLPCCCSSCWLAA